MEALSPSRSSAVLVLALVLLAAVACTGGDDAVDRDGEGRGEGGPRIDAPGIERRVELTGPQEEGAGEVPTFTWDPVEGAARYRLGVLDAEGDLVWAWEGPETTVVLGGVPDRKPEEGGPVVEAGSTWSVIAYDGEGLTIAVSEIRSVSP